MRLYLIVPFSAPRVRYVIAAPTLAKACEKANCSPDAAWIKDQTRFLLKKNRETGNSLPTHDAWREEGAA